ncbi:unnamed protein product [Protopolystoma xenopodis]|uniref:Amino acid permease/ SLC12A domain-containing protein n=1 Tax=Protopolystoma xenopodis TaxID=117903 RepID=A0A3S5CPL2_9PLAT|nr:unnamed protein product [Protopolystoma xenopodis]
MYYRFRDKICIRLGFKSAPTVEDTTSIFLGGRRLTLIPITASVMASFISAITLMGTNLEIYSNGVQFAIITLSYFVGFPIAAFFYMPVLYKLGITTAHEAGYYLEYRFNKLTRFLTTLIFLLQMCFM